MYRKIEWVLRIPLVAASVLPAILPPLFPQCAVKLLLSQFNIDDIMSLTHPHAQFILSFDLGRIAWLRHPILKIFGAHPTGI
jgi:hypothetical protein